jgi:hypothetical protein
MIEKMLAAEIQTTSILAAISLLSAPDPARFA